MAIAFACPGCGKRFKVDDDKAGRKGKCPACAALFEIPAAPAPRRSVAADEDALPRRRPARPAEDEDDRPRRRPADDYAADDYEEEERPRRRKKKKKKKSSTSLILGLVGGAVGLLLLIGGLVWAVVSLSGGGATVADDLKYVPDRPDAIAVFNFRKFQTSDLYKRLRTETPFLDILAQQSGGKAEDFDNLEWGTYAYTNMRDNSFVAVLRGKRAVSLEAEATRSSRKYPQEEEYSGYKVRHDALQGMATPERKALLVGPVLELRKLLERRGAKAVLSEPLQTAFNQLDLTKDLAMAVDFQAALTRNQQGAPFMLNPNQAAPPDSMLIHLDAGPTVNGSLTFNFKSEQDAENFKKQVESSMAMFKGPIPLPGMPPQVKDILKDLQVAGTGNRVNLTVSVDNNTVVEAAKNLPAFPRR